MTERTWRGNVPNESTSLPQSSRGYDVAASTLTMHVEDFMSRRLLVIAASFVTLGSAVATARAEDAAVYRTPPPIVADILTAARVPRGTPNVSPDGARMILPEYPSLISVSVLAEPVQKLAGLEILPALHCTRNQLKTGL